MTAQRNLKFEYVRVLEPDIDARPDFDGWGCRRGSTRRFLWVLDLLDRGFWMAWCQAHVHCTVSFRGWQFAGDDYLGGASEFPKKNWKGPGDTWTNRDEQEAEKRLWRHLLVDYRMDDNARREALEKLRFVATNDASSDPVRFPVDVERGQAMLIALDKWYEQHPEDA